MKIKHLIFLFIFSLLTVVGFSQENSTDSTKVIEVSDSTAVIEVSDSTAVIEVPDSTAVIEVSDSTAVIEVSDSTAVIEVSDSTAVIEVSDSTAVIEVSDSTAVIAVPDSTVVTAVPDSTVVTAVPDSTAVIAVPDSTAVMEVPDSTAVIAVPDSTAVIEVPDSTAVIAVTDSTKVVDEKESFRPEPLEIVFRPQLSLGTGMFTFYGDIGSNHKGYHPTVSRIGYDLRLINPINDYLDISFYVLFGQVSVSERTATRNLNFNSHITTGGWTLNYNFKQLLKPERNMDPYISFGIESMEFLSKSDMYDANGVFYNYWSDGTIRNMVEGSVGSENATEIYRDYVYESDIRELDLDGFGKYSERTFAIPVEVGANFHITDRIKFRVGTSMHFAFSDLVDGVTVESVGDRQGNKSNDKFLYSHFALSFDFNSGKIDSVEVDKLPIFDDMEKLDSIDSDGDLIVDFVDLCAKTPEGILVDKFGCPLDKDLDGVPDYLDEEKETKPEAIVNEVGVTLSDADFELAYRRYKDSLGDAYSIDVTSITLGEGSSVAVNTSGFTNDNEGFVEIAVVFDSDEGQLPKDIRDKLLSQPGFHVVESDDGTREYVVRGYKTLEEATAAMDQFKKDGMDVKGIAKVSKDEDLEFVSQEVIDKARAELLVAASTVDTSIVSTVDTSMVSTVDTSIVSNVDTNVSTIDMSLGTTYRVQIGAFRKELSTSVFSDARDVVYTEGDDDLFRYYSGSSNEKSKAAEHRIALLEMGYEGSFIVAFKDGKRIKLSEAKFDVIDTSKDVITDSGEPTGSVVRRELIRFRVQVGEYSGNVPTEVLDLYLAIGDVTFKRDPESGLIRSFLGWFESYDEAEEFQTELEREGLIDTFVIGDFNGKIISAQETLELLNE
jgi:hypothetical protein